jgi:hypothetical protein
MSLTLITLTGDRPDAFALCEAYMARQSHRAGRWIVVDDGRTPTRCTQGQQYIRREPRGSDPPQTLCLNLCTALEHGMLGDALAIIEDDDWYAPGHLAAMAAGLEHHDLYGEGLARYYNVAGRCHLEIANTAHASLCATAFRRSLVPTVLEVCRDPNPFADLQLWRAVDASRKRVDPALRNVVGIKGMPGRRGIGCGHDRTLPAYQPDPELSRLREWIGADADTYAPYRGAH